MRTFIVLSTDNSLRNEYISANVEYTLNQITDTVYYCKKAPLVGCSYMPTFKFKQALRDGDIVFTD